MRKLKLLFLVLFLSTLASARGVVTGFCETGAKQVSTQGVQSSTYVQRSNPSCTVDVYLIGTTTHATIFSTFAGGAQANPLTSASDGYYFFWADEGQYDLKLSGSTIGTPVTRKAAIGAVGAGGLLASNNLGDVSDVPTSRTNLGLGNSATKDVGVIAGTVAAGDDARLPTSGQKSALVGSLGTPGSANKYITQDDVSTTPTADLVPRALGTGKFSPNWLDYTGQYGTNAQPGFISAADWITFNAKQTPGSYLTSLTGDVVAAGPGAGAATIQANAVTLAKFQQIATDTILGRSTAATGNVEVLTTIPTAVQLNITKVGTLNAGSVPYSLITGAPATANAASDGVTKGVVTFISSDFTCTAGQCLINYANGQKATSLLDGLLNHLDWVTFNAKQPAGSYITQLTGDVTAIGPGSVAATLANIPTGVPMAGYIRPLCIVAPGTPAATFGRVYCDSTSKNLAMKNDAGIINHGVQTKAAVANNYVTSIDDDGTVNVAPPITAHAVANGLAIGSVTAAGVFNDIVTPAYLHLLCTGVATSSATMYVRFYGSNACTNTTETIAAGAEILTEHAGFIQNLRVKSNAAGFAAGSGVFTIGVNGTGDTTVTCTVGTGTTCNDGTHSVAVIAGARLYVKMVTMATETIADVMVTFEY